MAEASREWKEPAQYLWHLILDRKGTECDAKDAKDTDTQLETVEKLNAKDGSGRKTIGPEKKHKVCGGKIGIYVLHAQECCKQQPAPKQT
jgi:hypothetical protein